jgi:hypothetical protein
MSSAKVQKANELSVPKGMKVIKGDLKKGGKIVLQCEKTGRVKVSTLNKEPSLCDRSYKSQCDIVHIVKHYQKTGEIAHVNRRKGQYADVSEIEDLHPSLCKVMDAEREFNSMPEAIRRQFGSYANYVAFLDSESRKKEAQKLGLKKDTDSSDKSSEAKAEPKEDVDGKGSGDSKSDS